MNKGFSLLEMTFVLLALSFLLSGLLSPLSARIMQFQIRQTDEQLQQTIDALIGFAILQNRLPCPDADGGAASGGDGREDTANCDSEGDLPWADLGVNGKDKWNQTLRYRVQKNFTSTTTAITATTTPCSTCQFKIQRKDGTRLTVFTGDSNVIALVFSRGKNRKGDAENDVNNADQIYMMDDLFEDNDKISPDNTFDDQIKWLSKNELFYRMVTANTIYP
jgi:type II secretory pathway pseudopilin PulG